jgi:carbonic anhydrase
MRMTIVLARGLVPALALVLAATPAHADTPAPAASPEQVLKRLLDGNHAFVSGGASCPGQSPARRTEVATAQHPVAVIVGCADSRVPPETVFNQGIGDLFVVRVAGNVIDDSLLGSIEYAVEHFGVSLVMVLGHERCGAVEAALSPKAAPAHIAAVVSRIRAAIGDARKQPGDAVDNAVRANVAASVRDVLASPIVAPATQKGRVKVVGARYDLDSGTVELLR